MTAFQHGIDSLFNFETQKPRTPISVDKKIEIFFSVQNQNYQLVSFCDNFFDLVRERFGVSRADYLTQLSSMHGVLVGGRTRRTRRQQADRREGGDIVSRRTRRQRTRRKR